MELRLWEKVDALRQSIVAANQYHLVRRHLYVEMVDGATSGWGEITPLESSLFHDPGVDQVRAELVSHTLGAVAATTEREGSVPQWSRVHLLARHAAASRWAFAAVEMALLDFELKNQRETLEQHWQVDVTSVPLMATTSFQEFDLAWRPRANVSRVRIKTAPQVEFRSWLPVVASWGQPIILDFNGSADSFATVHQQVDTLSKSVDLVAVEQPFHVGDLMSHASLARELDVAVSLDEGVRSVLDVRQIARYAAASLVCIKPPRVGGIAIARAMLSEADQLGLRTYVGGFFDSPLARRVHAGVAAGFPVEPSDVGPVEFAASEPSTPTVHEPVGYGFGVEPAKSELTLLKTVTVG